MANHLCECANDNLFLFFIYLFFFYENRYSRIEGERNKWRQEYLIKLKYFIICRNYFCFKFLPWKFLNKLAAVTKLFFSIPILTVTKTEMMVKTNGLTKKGILKIRIQFEHFSLLIKEYLTDTNAHVHNVP